VPTVDSLEVNVNANKMLRNEFAIGAMLDIMALVQTDAKVCSDFI